MNGHQQLYDAILHEVQDFKARVAAGEAIDLGSFDDKIEALTDAVKGLPINEGQAYMQQLEALLGEVTSLGEMLVNGRDAIKLQMDNAEVARRANKAYAKVEHSVPPAKKEVEEKK